MGDVFSRQAASQAELSVVPGGVLRAERATKSLKAGIKSCLD